MKEYTMAAAASNTAGEIDPIADFCSICNVQPDVAERYLHATRGSLTIGEPPPSNFCARYFNGSLFSVRISYSH